MKRYLLLILGVLFIILISCLPSLAYFSYKQNIDGVITLGELDFSIKYNNSNLLNIVPGDKINIDLSILNSRKDNGADYQNLVDFYIRFSFDLLVDGDTFKNFTSKFNTQSILQCINDTYYHLGKVSAGAELKLLDSIEINKLIDNNFQGKDISLIFNIDAIQASKEAVSELWPEIYEYLYT